MWVGTAVWAFSIAALAVVTVQISTLAASPFASMRFLHAAPPCCWGSCRLHRGVGAAGNLGGSGR